MDKFKVFNAMGKHNLNFRVYQYTADGYPGLNCETPNEFQTHMAEAKLSKIVAYYIAHALKQKPFVVKNNDFGQSSYTLVVLLWFLAIDSKGRAEATDISPYSLWIYGDGKLSLDDVFKYYNSLNFRIVSELAEYLMKEIRDYHDCLCVGGIGIEPIFVTDKGKQKLKSEWPEIWNEFDLDDVK